MDIKTSFLNGMIEEEVYIEQPYRFDVENMEMHVCRLHQYFYVLKHAPQAWYSRIDIYIWYMVF